MKLLVKTFLVTICIALSFSGVLAQKAIDKGKEEIEAKRSAAMKKLDFLIGTWKGTGWILNQNGRQTFTVTEKMERKLGGQIVVIEGLGKSIDKETGKERIVHQAYGIFSYDKDSGKIKFRWYKADGGEEDETTIEVSDNKFIWGFDVSQTGSKVKFTEVINEKGNWLEIGEFSRDDGKTWLKFFEMELSKVSE